MSLLKSSLVVIAALAATATPALAVTLSANITFEESVVVDTATDGLVAVATNSGGGYNPDTDSFRYAESKATAGSLHSYSISSGVGGGPLHPRFRGNAKMVLDDVIFSAAPGITDPFLVTLNTTLDGAFHKVQSAGGTNFAIGAGYVIGEIRTGNLYGSSGLIEAGKLSELRFESGLDGSVLGATQFSGVLSQSFLVLPNVARSITLSLSTEANGGLLNFKIYGVAADASNSLLINPEKVFDLPDGVTVNSASWGLVNNQLPYLLQPEVSGVVPVPAALPLLLAGLGSLAAVRRRG